MFKILFDGDGEFEVSESGQSLLQVSREHGVPHVSVCGGKGRCSTCRVVVLQGEASVPARNDVEAALAETKGLADDVRLACQTCVSGDVHVRRLVHDEIDRRLVMAESGARPPREVTLAVLFSDIRGFTTFAESQLPYDVVHILNRYFHAMGGAIQDNGGYIDKYMGDGIMALFGLDSDDPAAACRDAVAASKDMLRRLVDENKMLETQFDTRFRIGVGIHVGEVVIGEMGHPERMAFTAIGDTVNVASRVESSTKEAGVPILVSDAVRDFVPELVSEDAPFETHLKGRSGTALLYPLRDA
jgi:adenylate cyclase